MTTGDSDSHSSRGGDSDGGPTPPQNHSHPAENGNNNGTKETPPTILIKPRRVDLAALTKMVQVANIAPQATRDQMQALFGYLGKIEDLRLYPTIDLGMQHTSKICFVKFYESASVGVAQHLTNTVFVDRALIVIPFIGADIPDESKALELLGSGSLLPGIADPKLPQHVTSQLEGVPPMQVVVTRDIKLSENHLPVYPNLPPTFDSRRIEEIRRTIMLANLDPEVPVADVVEFCSCAGEVKYFRLCTRDNDPIHYALVEFTEQPSVLEALKLNGTTLGSKFVKVYHATQAIIKPQAKTNEAAQKEIEEAMSHQAQTLLTHGLDGPSKEKRRSRSISRGRHSGARPKSRSRSRRRSRSRSRRRVKRSRSLSRSRSVSRGRVRRSRSHGRVRRSPRRAHRSRSRDRTRRSTSRSHRSKRSGSKKREKKSKKDKDRDRTKDREGRENGVKHEESVHKLEGKEEMERDRERGEKRKSSPTRSAKDKNRSPGHDKKRSKSKKKKKDSDREESEERSRRSRSSSVDKGKLSAEAFNS